MRRWIPPSSLALILVAVVTSAPASGDEDRYEGVNGATDRIQLGIVGYQTPQSLSLEYSGAPNKTTYGFRFGDPATLMGGEFSYDMGGRFLRFNPAISIAHAGGVPLLPTTKLQNNDNTGALALGPNPTASMTLFEIMLGASVRLPVEFLSFEAGVRTGLAFFITSPENVSYDSQNLFGGLGLDGFGAIQVTPFCHFGIAVTAGYEELLGEGSFGLLHGGVKLVYQWWDEGMPLKCSSTPSTPPTAPEPPSQLAATQPDVASEPAPPPSPASPTPPTPVPIPTLLAQCSGGALQACEALAHASLQPSDRRAYRTAALKLAQAAGQAQGDDRQEIDSSIRAMSETLSTDAASQKDLQVFLCAGGDKDACATGCSGGDVGMCHAGCARGSGTCTAFGDHVMQGQGVPKDAALAQGIYAQACTSGGEGEGCLALARQALAGDGVPVDKGLAKKALAFGLANGLGTDATKQQMTSLYAPFAQADAAAGGKPSGPVYKTVQLQTCLPNMTLQERHDSCVAIASEAQCCLQIGPCWDPWHADRISSGVISCSNPRLNEHRVIDDGSGSDTPTAPPVDQVDGASSRAIRAQFENGLAATAAKSAASCAQGDACCEAWSRVTPLSKWVPAC